VLQFGVTLVLQQYLTPQKENHTLNRANPILAKQMYETRREREKLSPTSWRKGAEVSNITSWECKVEGTCALPYLTKLNSLVG
jgi:hypothetical protein